jgi:Protein of unknown function (DUF664)
MIGEFAKEYLHDDLRQIREALVWKLDGLCEYDIRRPLTFTGTNLLGLVKHSATWEARYFGEVFGRPFPEPLSRWDDEAANGTDLWVTQDETREQIIGFYRRAWEHADATIGTLAIDAPGHVPWWPRPDVKLFNILVHILAETSRHAGHADILREQLDSAVGTDAQSAAWQEHDAAYWENHRAKIERAARAADPAHA